MVLTMFKNEIINVICKRNLIKVIKASIQDAIVFPKLPLHFGPKKGNEL